MAELGIRRLMWGAAAVALSAPAVTAAAASAATITPVYQCFVNPKPSQAGKIGLVGAGFTPGDDIEIEGDGIADHGPAAANGSVAFVTSGPLLSTIDPAYKIFTVSALDETNPANNPLATTKIRVANFAFATKPSAARLSATVRWTFSGFPVGKALYAHFTRGGRQVGALKFGHAKSPCGTLSARAPFFPVSPAKAGTYGVQVDTSRSYSKTTTPRITSSLTTY